MKTFCRFQRFLSLSSRPDAPTHQAPILLPSIPPLPNPLDLTGTAWRLEQLDGRDVIDDSKASLTVSREGRMGGNTGCNAMFGHAMLDGNQSFLRNHRLDQDGLHGSPVMEQERRYFDALKQVATWRIEDGRLYFADHARKVVLVYEPKD